MDEIQSSDTAADHIQNDFSELYSHAVSMEETTFLSYTRQEQRDINLLNQRGFSALHTTAEEGQINAMRNLLNAGADVNGLTTCGKTSLAIAAYNGHVECCKTLINFGARVNNLQSTGMPPLVAATINGHARVVLVLLGSGACVNLKYSGFTPLIYAASFRLFDIDVSFGTDLQERPSKRSPQNKSSGMNGNKHNILAKKVMVTLHNKTRVIEALLEYAADPNIMDELGNHALIHATNCNMEEHFSGHFGDEIPECVSRCVRLEAENRCRILVEHGAKVNLAGENGMTALMHSASNDLPLSLEHLLNNGASPNQMDNKGWTALMHALENNSTKCCKVLAKGSVLGKFLKNAKSFNISEPNHVHQPPLPLKEHWDLYKHATLKDKQELQTFVKHKSDDGVKVKDDVGVFALILAIQNRQLQALKNLIDVGVNINARIIKGKPILNIVAELGYTDCFQFLIDKNASVDVSQLGEPLMSACMKGQMDMVKLLLQAGANVNQICNGKTALMVAVSHDYSKELSSDLQNFGNAFSKAGNGGSGDPNSQNSLARRGDKVSVPKQERNPVKQEKVGELNKQAISLIQNKTKIVQVLLEAGADPNVRDDYGRNALIFIVEFKPTYYFTRVFPTCVPQSVRFALDRESGERLRCLVNHGVDVNIQDGYGMTALMHAARNNLVTCCERLISEHTHINQMDDRNWTALIYAAVSNSAGCCRLLLYYGADCNLADIHGMTPLMHAIKHKSSQAFRILAEESDLRLCDKDGRTPLMYAVNTICVSVFEPNSKDDTSLNFVDFDSSVYIRNEDIDFCMSLIQRGADFNQQDANGKTALIQAVEKGLIEKCKTLVIEGTDINIQDNTGKTAVMHAVLKKNFHLWKGAIRSFITRGFGIDFDVQDNEGMTVLMYIAKVDSGEQCPQFRFHVANLNLQDKNGMTVLMYAILFDCQWMCDRILSDSIGVDVNIQDNDGRSALMYAALYESWIIFTRLLRKHGADVNVKDNEGRTVLDYAVRRRYFNLLQASGMDGTISQHEERLALVPLLKDINYIQKGISTTGFKNVSNINTILDKRLETACLMLKRGANPFLPDHHLLLHEFFETSEEFESSYETTSDRMSVIEDDVDQMFRLLVCNGIFQKHMTGQNSLLSKCLDDVCLFYVAKYLIASCYITSWDLKEMRLSEYFTLRELLPESLSHPWPLVKLAFIAVSSALGGGPERNRRVSQTQLPPRIQRMLMFQEPVTRLSVKHWDDIPLFFDPVEYERQPKPRPLLYYWPFGRELNGGYFEEENTDSETDSIYSI